MEKKRLLELARCELSRRILHYASIQCNGLKTDLERAVARNTEKTLQSELSSVECELANVTGEPVQHWGYCDWNVK